MSGAREARARQGEALINASPIGRSNQEMTGARGSPARQGEASRNVSPTRSASAIARSLKKGRNDKIMMIFKKAIPRRTFIRGAGVTLALPLLDGMIPALAAPDKPVKRFSIVYVPNGRIMEQWTPKTDGTGFELPLLLEPFAPFRDRLLVVTGLTLNIAKHFPGEEVGVHERPCGAYLTGVHPKWTDGADIHNGISLDQIVAKEFGKYTQLASLEVSLDSAGILGACEKGWSCAYINTLCWRSPTTPIPMENNPRRAFERLFGDVGSTESAERRAIQRRNNSILDSLSEATADLIRGLGPGDRAKISEYLDSIRDIERRIQIAEQESSRDLPSLARPSGVPATFQEHARLMFDLQVLAFQADLTRMITFMVGREKTDRPYPEIGIPDAHHPLTHHAGDPQKIEKVVRIEALQAKMFAYYLEKLRSTPDGDGSLLDHMVINYGCGISEGNGHSVVNLPLVLVGGASYFKGGRHIRYPKGPPLSNLHLTLLDKLGIPVENFGDSTGKLDLLAV